MPIKRLSEFFIGRLPSLVTLNFHDKLNAPYWFLFKRAKQKTPLAANLFAKNNRKPQKGWPQVTFIH